MRDQVSRLPALAWSSVRVWNLSSVMASSLDLTPLEESSTRWMTPRWTWPTSLESSLMRAMILWEVAGLDGAVD